MNAESPNPFAHRLVVAAELAPQQITRRHWDILVQLDRPDLGLRSPIRRMRAEKDWLQRCEEDGIIRHFTEEERAEIVFTLARPIEEVEVEFMRGRYPFRQAAVASVEDKLPDLLIEELLCAVLESFHLFLLELEREMRSPPQP